MTTEALTIPGESSAARPVVADLRLVALSPQQLAVEQARLIDWCAAKASAVTADANDLRENLAIHKRNKWRTGALTRALQRSNQQVTFYTKVQEALRAGFHIVPNFDADVFAIRTTRAPRGSNSSTYSSQSAVNNLPDQKAEALPVGSGRYESPTPVGRSESWTDTKDGKQVVKYAAHVTGYADIDFPFSFARPEVLNATQAAMAMKLFDEMASLPQTRKADPMIVGRIRKPWVQFGNDHITFLVVWFLDTNMV